MTAMTYDEYREKYEKPSEGFTQADWVEDDRVERERNIRLVLDFRCYSKEWQARETAADAIRILTVNGFKVNYRLEDDEELIVGQKRGDSRPSEDIEVVLDVTQ